MSQKVVSYYPDQENPTKLEKIDSNNNGLQAVPKSNGIEECSDDETIMDVGLDVYTDNSIIDKTFKSRESEQFKNFEKHASFLTESNTVTEHVIISTKQGEQFALNRRFLALESLYFRVLFYGDYLESKQKLVNLPDIEGYSFTQALSISSAIRRGEEPLINLTQAIELLPVASFLCMDNLLLFLSTVIESRITPGSIIQVFRKAIQHHYPLSQLLWKIIIREFQVLIERQTFLQMSELEMLEVLRDERTNISVQDEIKAINQFLASRPILDQQNILSHVERKKFRMKGDGSSLYPVLMNRVPHEVIVVLGGWCTSGATDIVETYNPRRNKWVDGKPLGFQCDTPRAYHCVSAFGDHMFTCGGMNGRDFFRDSNCFNLITKTWNPMAGMLDKRCYLGGVGFQDSSGAQKVFVGGGFNGTERLSSCEIMSINENSWEIVPSMMKRRSDFALVKVGSHLYAVGGFDGQKIHRDMEYFDIGKETWYPLMAEMREPRTGVNAVAVDENTLLVCGGYNGKIRLRSTEFYDRREGRFHLLYSMHTPRSNYGITYSNGKVCVAGGFDGLRTTASTEYYDIKAAKWIKTADLNSSKSALKLISLRDHPSIRNLINFDSTINLD